MDAKQTLIIALNALVEVKDALPKNTFVDLLMGKGNKEIEENNFNLNIPRYVDTFEEEEPIDIKEVQANIKKIDEELEELYKSLEDDLKELGL